MLQALVHDAQGHPTAGPAGRWPTPWREAPEPGGYVRLFLDEGAPMIELLRDAERNNTTAASDSSPAAQPRRVWRSPTSDPMRARRHRGVVERAGAAGAAAARQRAERAADRPRAVRLAQHAAHPHQAHLHQARRHQPSGGGRAAARRDDGLHANGGPCRGHRARSHPRRSHQSGDAGSPPPVPTFESSRGAPPRSTEHRSRT